MMMMARRGAELSVCPPGSEGRCTTLGRGCHACAMPPKVHPAPTASSMHRRLLAPLLWWSQSPRSTPSTAARTAAHLRGSCPGVHSRPEAAHQTHLASPTPNQRRSPRRRHPWTVAAASAARRSRHRSGTTRRRQHPSWPRSHSTPSALRQPRAAAWPARGRRPSIRRCSSRAGRPGSAGPFGAPLLPSAPRASVPENRTAERRPA